MAQRRNMDSEQRREARLSHSATSPQHTCILFLRMRVKSEVGSPHNACISTSRTDWRTTRLEVGVPTMVLIHLSSLLGHHVLHLRSYLRVRIYYPPLERATFDPRGVTYQHRAGGGGAGDEATMGCGLCSLTSARGLHVNL